MIHMQQRKNTMAGQSGGAGSLQLFFRILARCNEIDGVCTLCPICCIKSWKRHVEREQRF